MDTCEPEQEELNLSASIESSMLPEFNSASQPESSILDYCTESKNQENALDLISSSDAVSAATQDTGLPDQPNSTDTVATQNHGGAAVDLDICLSQHLPQGIITRQGNMIQFVASDLMEKIKCSSSVSQTDVFGFGGRRLRVHSESSATAGSRMSKSSGYLLKQSPNIPYISTSVADELEIHARRVADSLDLMMGNIRNTLYKMSAITSGCQEAYQRSVDITCDSVDTSIKSMYTLMAKCDELRDALVPVEKLTVQIKEIKNILDLFETHMTDK